MSARRSPLGATLEERLLVLSTPARNGCRVWSAHVDRGGYGRLMLDGRKVSAHRTAYELWVGPIPEGLTVDHLCFNPGCITPEHLRLLTHVENSLNRRARLNLSPNHCINEHHLTEANTYWEKRSKQDRRLRRRCRACLRNRNARRRMTPRIPAQDVAA